ncbi:hypothetical protein GQ42DRAFT_159441 [Ramicandelaber brevisporus]|nr:hypothetical protein GQ42DRAFT_159441 [Ramicandelaber brevisporus]
MVLLGRIQVRIQEAERAMKQTQLDIAQHKRDQAINSRSLRLLDALHQKAPDAAMFQSVGKMFFAATADQALGDIRGDIKSSEKAVTALEKKLVVVEKEHKDANSHLHDILGPVLAQQATISPPSQR